MMPNSKKTPITKTGLHKFDYMIPADAQACVELNENL